MNNPWKEIALPEKDVSARRIDAEHPLNLFWARNHQGQYLFIYEFPASEDFPPRLFPDLRGITSRIVAASDRERMNRLVLILNEQANWEIFYSICVDIFHSTRHLQDQTGAVQAILRRINRWHEFLKKQRSDLLNEEEIKGLIGELLFIRTYLAPTFGWGKAIKSWGGPEGFPQDFNINNVAVEVKCQSGTTKPNIHISSIEQLCPQLPDMYLYVVTLGNSMLELEGALHLPGLVASIRSELYNEGATEIERFNDLLYMTGYIDSDRYLDFSYIKADEKMYRVLEGFPRICPDEIHPGIVKISYSINLLDCDAFIGWPEWMVA